MFKDFQKSYKEPIEVDEHSSIKLENNIFDSFVDDCKNTKKPNKYLKEAFKFAKKQGFFEICV